jgi:hypothetical protein
MRLRQPVTPCTDPGYQRQVTVQHSPLRVVSSFTPSIGCSSLPAMLMQRHLAFGSRAKWQEDVVSDCCLHATEPLSDAVLAFGSQSHTIVCLIHKCISQIMA